LVARSRSHGGAVLSTHALQPYVREIADAMRLRDWDIEVDGSKLAEEGRCAQTRVSVRRKSATIRLGSCWASDSREEQRDTVVHELLHLHFEPLYEGLRNLRNNVGESAWSVANNAFNDAAEQAIDQLARVLAERFPLPPEAAA
jgi:hypothetical protein